MRRTLCQLFVTFDKGVPTQLFLQEHYPRGITLPRGGTPLISYQRAGNLGTPRARDRPSGPRPCRGTFKRLRSSSEVVVVVAKYKA